VAGLAQEVRARRRGAGLRDAGAGRSRRIRNIATLGTAPAVLFSIPIAFLAARNTTFNWGTYALGRVVMSVSRSVDSLI
jgi:hypothetical protein